MHLHVETKSIHMQCKDALKTHPIKEKVTRIMSSILVGLGTSLQLNVLCYQMGS